ncbi:MAG: MobF family relaxase [Verrucomicrobiota bacterium]
MVSIHIHRTPGKLTDYHEEHLEKGILSDYYAKDASPQVCWSGGLAHRFGLLGLPVTKEQFERLAKNLHPINGTPLTLRKKFNARSAYDFVFSMPKSVSTLALVTGDKRILDAHRKALAKVVAYMERFAMGRVRKGGANDDRVTGNFITAIFEHLTSRENDPQVHSHVVIMNCTFDETEGTMKALQALELFRRRGLLTEIYRSALVAELRAIGYRTKATEKGFEIAGVFQSVIDTFSKRHKQIDAIAAQLKAKRDNYALRAGIARKHRKAKDTSLSIDDLRASWEAQLSTDDLARLHSVVASATVPLNLPRAELAGAIDWAAKHHFERKSAVRMTELVTSTLAAERGHFEADKVEAAITANQSKFIVVDGFVTTHDALAAEKELIANINAGIGELAPLNENFGLPARLNAEQREVVSSILLCPDRYSLLIGPPGSRKTSTLQPIVAAAKDAHLQVTLLAPSSSAADTLHKDGFADAITMQRFLLDRDAQTDAAGGLVVLDESGLASVSDILALTKLSKQYNYRLLIVGDENQHKSVTAGDSLSLLSRHTSIHRTELKTLRRQEHAGYLKAVTHFKDGKFADGIKVFSSLGWIHEADFDERYSLLAADYSAAVSRKEHALAVAATWREAALVTEAVRASERSAGRLIGPDVTFSSLVPAHHTHAERERSHLISDGSVLVFSRKSKLFARSEQVSVVGHLDGLLTVRRADGEILVIDPKKHAAGFQVFQTRDIHVAAGDSLLLRANGKAVSGSRLVNGQLVCVKSIQNGIIMLDDGRSLPPSYRHIAHGYCITSHASQGKTVDRVFLAIDAQSAASAATQETLYVATSRGRFSCDIYTDGKPELEAAFSRSSARIAAIELTKDYEQVPIPTNRQLPLSAGLNRPNHPVSSRRRSDSRVGSEPPHSPALPEEPRPGQTRQSNRDGRGRSFGVGL